MQHWQAISAGATVLHLRSQHESFATTVHVTWAGPQATPSTVLAMSLQLGSKAAHAINALFQPVNCTENAEVVTVIKAIYR
eukprot:4763302-Amphidinium_carterae.1